MTALYEKKQILEDSLRRLGSVVISFSSGVDSTFLLKTAHDLLGDQVLAVTARLHSVPEREIREAIAFCEAGHIRHKILDFDELSVEGFCQNPKDRCLLCKRGLFTGIREIAALEGIPHVAEGSNTDDAGDYRPGMRALMELGIKSPLREAGLTKKEIRQLSREAGLSTWDKPSFACLSSRFAYGEPITKEKLAMVDKAEQRLLDMGFRQVRVRVHNNLARVEILPEEFSKILEGDTAAELDRFLKSLGFAYASLDLRGYRTGSMNEVL